MSQKYAPGGHAREKAQKGVPSPQCSSIGEGRGLPPNVLNRRIMKHMQMVHRCAAAKLSRHSTLIILPESLLICSTWSRAIASKPGSGAYKIYAGARRLARASFDCFGGCYR